MNKVRSTRNFVDLNIDYVIKLGGSLTSDIVKAKQLAATLAATAGKIRMVIFPGGGPIDNYIESVDRQFALHEQTHHQACARAQDQTGLIFANFDLQVFETTDNVQGIRDILNRGKIPVLLPSTLIFLLDPFEKTWDITSDSMGAYFSYLLEAREFVILTDVDGVYDQDPKKHAGAKLISNLNSNDLSAMGMTSVDKTLSDFVNRSKTDCRVLNGHNFDNLTRFFHNQDYIGTYISHAKEELV